jgi:hypothetical protein
LRSRGLGCGSAAGGLQEGLRFYWLAQRLLTTGF